MARRSTFPQPHALPTGARTLFLPRAELLSLYARDTGRFAEKVSARVQEWAREQSVAWSDIEFPRSYDNPSAVAGCMLTRSVMYVLRRAS